MTEFLVHKQGTGETVDAATEASPVSEARGDNGPCDWYKTWQEQITTDMPHQILYTIIVANNSSWGRGLWGARGSSSILSLAAVRHSKLKDTSIRPTAGLEITSHPPGGVLVVAPTRVQAHAYISLPHEQSLCIACQAKAIQEEATRHLYHR